MVGIEPSGEDCSPPLRSEDCGGVGIVGLDASDGRDDSEDGCDGLGMDGCEGFGMDGSDGCDGLRGLGMDGLGDDGEGIDGDGLDGEGMDGEGVEGDGVEGDGRDGDGMEGEGMDGEDGLGGRGGGGMLTGDEQAATPSRADQPRQRHAATRGPPAGRRTRIRERFSMADIMAWLAGLLGIIRNRRLVRQYARRAERCLNVAPGARPR